MDTRVELLAFLQAEESSNMVDEALENAIIEYSRKAMPENEVFHTVIDGHIVTSSTNFDVTSNLSELSIFHLLRLKAFLYTFLKFSNDNFKVKKLIKTLHLQIIKIIVQVSMVKDIVFDIFTPSYNELNLSYLLLHIHNQETYYRYSTNSTSY